MERGPGHPQPGAQNRLEEMARDVWRGGSGETQNYGVRPDAKFDTRLKEREQALVTVVTQG